MKKQKVLMAMSGGVDSSVAALIIKQNGYEVIGAFMKNWSDTKDEFGICKWQDDRKEALKIATKLNIPLITLDFEKEYRALVVNEMYKLYAQGITPNPDVDCNNKIKWPLLWKAAKKLGCNFIATGHYARIRKINSKNNKANEKQASLIKNSFGRASNFARTNFNANNQAELREGGKRFYYEILRAKDESKDQSYFLYRLTQKDLEHTLFPIGDLTKTKVREIARKNGFNNFDRKSTVGICFIGKVNLKRFLQKKIKSKKGKILNPTGEIIGEHDGIYYYTIGQRLGPRFGIDVNRGSGKQERWYVASKNPRTNTIIAAPEGHKLNFRKEIIIKDDHWINKKPKSGRVLSRIRQVGELLPSTLFYKNGRYKITLNKPITGVSEGQAIVLYKKKVCLGGGVIAF